jgi:hypothetical protein
MPTKEHRFALYTYTGTAMRLLKSITILQKNNWEIAPFTYHSNDTIPNDQLLTQSD